MVGLSSVIIYFYILFHLCCSIWCMLAGVKAGMFVKEAKTRCPELVIVPYDFGAYEMVMISLDQFNDLDGYESVFRSSCSIICMWVSV